MITVISPAKSLDFENPVKLKKSTQPKFIQQAEQLISELRTLAPQEIASLMGISDKLALVNFDRFQSFKPPFTKRNAKQAMFVFNGDVYQGLDAQSLSEKEVDFAQKHLRILSGLYGILKPLDLMQPYRLEMGTRLANSGGKNLYQFWDQSLRESLEQELGKHSQPTLVNLASTEYFKAVKAKQLGFKVITPHFKDFKNGQFKMISFFAKRARGLMSRFIIQNKIDQPQGLREFNLGGYYYDPKLSSETDWYFLRTEPQS